MKTFLLLAGLLAIVVASPAKVDLLKQPKLMQSTKELLQLQRAVLRLLQNVDQANFYSDQVQIGESYDIEANIDSYTNPQAVREFMDLNRLGFLPRGEIFSVFYEQQRREAIALFKVLYYAMDYNTFYRTACWARIFMNEGMFIYSLSVALVQRPDTAMIQLPPIYEISPNCFFRMDVLQEARKAREMYEEKPKSMLEVEPEGRREYMPKPWQGEPWKQLGEEESLINKKEMSKMEMPESQMPNMQMPNMQMPNMQMPDTQMPEMQTPRMPMPTMPMPQAMQVQMLEFRRQQMAQDQMMMPWFNMMPEPIRTQWIEQWRQQQLMREQVRMEQLRQEQLLIEERFRQAMEQGQQPQSEFKGITIDANYTNSVSISYFTEDVGLNAYYYYYNIYFPFWLPNEMINFKTERRGEQFYYMMQQLLARYYLERLSNGITAVPALDYLVPIRTGYRPSMMYPNGMRFPERPDNFWLPMEMENQNLPIDSNYSNAYMFVRDYERRIRDAIDLGYIMTSTGKQVYLYEARGFEMLGNMIEGNLESPNLRFYGILQIFARHILGNSGYSVQNYTITPSVLEHFQTSLRDPVFYRFATRMLMYFQRYMRYVPPYSTKEMLMPGVKIQDVEVDRLVTYFDDFFVDITNAVNKAKREDEPEIIPVRVRQMRLNHKPFNYFLNVMADKPYQAMVKVFLGPKFDETGRRLDITENRLNFVELDKFPVLLNVGMNRVQRNSGANFYSRDRTSMRELYMQVMMDLNRPGMPELVPREPEWGMPRRFLLPKGTKAGQMYQMYFIITPYRPAKDEVSSKKTMVTPKLNWRRAADNYPLGYPLDRPIDESVFYVPNSLFKDVMIYNMETEEMRQTEM